MSTETNETAADPSGKDAGALRSYEDISTQAPTSVTEILNAALDRQDALDRAFGCVYPELKRIAYRVLGSGGHATLNPTSLVHEAYAKLIGGETLSLGGRQHFYALCARTMRQIVVDYARSRMSAKRGGGIAALPLNEDGVAELASPETILALDLALDWIEQRDPRLVTLLHYRVFAGMELPEIALLMGVTTRQLQRDWQRARIWMTEALVETAR